MGLVPAWVDPEWRTAGQSPPRRGRSCRRWVVDADAVAARADKRVGIGVFVENGLDGGHVLVGELRPTTPSPVSGLYGLPIPESSIRCTLWNWKAPIITRSAGCSISRPGRRRRSRRWRGISVVGQVDLQHVGVSPQLKAFFLAQRRQNVYVRRGFRVHVAGVAAAETAEVARAHLRAVGVGIGVGGVGRRQVIGVIPHFQRRFFKQLRRPGVFLRRQRESSERSRAKALPPRPLPTTLPLIDQAVRKYRILFPLYRRMVPDRPRGDAPKSWMIISWG